MSRIVKLHHLKLNHNTWVVRYQIPKDCRHLFDGKREYLKSTGYKKPEVIGAELVRDIKVATIQKIIWNFKVRKWSELGLRPSFSNIFNA